jgi:hypothetical protein
MPVDKTCQRDVTESINVISELLDEIYTKINSVEAYTGKHWAMGVVMEAESKVFEVDGELEFLKKTLHYCES